MEDYEFSDELKETILAYCWYKIYTVEICVWIKISKTALVCNECGKIVKMIKMNSNLQIIEDYPDDYPNPSCLIWI